MVDVKFNKEINLSGKYDLTHRYAIYRSLLAEREYLLKTQRSAKSYDAFCEYIYGKIYNFENDGGRFLIDSIKISIPKIDPKTLSNFCKPNLDALLNFDDSTVMVFDAFFKITKKIYNIIYRNSEDFIRSFGRSMSLFYTPFEELRKFGQHIEKILFGIEGTYLILNPHSDIVSPKKVQFALINFRRIPDTAALFCVYVPVSKPFGFAHFDLPNDDLVDWSEERYSGIASFTRDGIACHLTSFNARVPAYVLVKENFEEVVAPFGPLRFSYFSFQSAGFINKYVESERIDSQKITNFFANISMVL